MSTPGRRPTGSSRRPQVAGRPRTASPAPPAESEETTEGGLAVDERADTRSGADRGRTATAEPGDSGGDGGTPRARTVARPGSRPAGDEEESGAPATEEPADGSPSGPDEADGAAGAGNDAGLPSAPSVRTGKGPDPAESSDFSDSSDSADSPEPGGRGAGLVARVRRMPLPQAPATRRGTAALLAVTILLVAAAGFFAVSWARLQFAGATSNTALTDVGATATVSEQINEAVTKVYSFDFARLDQAESDARGVITGPFSGQFDQIFGNVRQLAPKQQAVVTATIPKSAVSSIDGDDATVYVFVNQVVRRVDDGGKPQEGTAAARLRVDAEYVDGRWKIAGMSPA